MYCKEARQLVLERTLEEGDISADSALGRHLLECADCRAFLAQVREVDLALAEMPLERTPAAVTERILAQVPMREKQMEAEPFLSWTLWVTAGSLLVGLVWAYLSWLWRNWPGLTESFTPTVLEWPAQLERWLGSQQDPLSAVILCIAAGMLLTVIGVALGLYVGRERVVHGH